MTTADVAPLAYPFNTPDGLQLAEAYEQVRERPGLLRVQLPYGEPAWLVTRYVDARLVLGDQRFSRAAAASHDEPRQSEGQRDGGILGMDPPDHTRLRSLVAKAFTVRQVEKLRPQVRELTATLLDEMETAGPPADLVDLFALPLPVAVICRMLGVPTEDRPRFRVWSDDALSTSSLTAEEFDASREELRAYMAGLIDQHRRAPQDDLMTALIEARDGGDRLSELELVDLCVGILVAGHETTASQIPNFVLTLLDHPDQLARLRAEPVSSRTRWRSCCASCPWAAAPVNPVTPPRTSRSAGPSSSTAARSWSPSAPPTATHCGSPPRASSTSPARATSTSDSATASTTAWAPRWPGWSSRRRWPPSSPASRPAAGR